MKVKMLNLEDLVKALTSGMDPADVDEALKRESETLRRQNDALTSWRKAVVAATADVLEQYVEACSQNNCDDVGHRMVPLHSQDWHSVHNIVMWAAERQLDASHNMVRVSYDIGKDPMQGAHPEPLTEAMYVVTSAGMLAATKILSDGSENPKDFLRKFHDAVRLMVTSSNERALTGKNPTERPKHGNCH